MVACNRLFIYPLHKAEKKGIENMKLNEKIYFCRKRSGFSQEALAEQVGVSRQAVSKWETGESQPEVGKLLTLARVFGVTTDWLLSEEEPGYDARSEQEEEPSTSPRQDGIERLPGFVGQMVRRYGWLAGAYIALCGLGFVIVGVLALVGFNAMFAAAEEGFSSVNNMWQGGTSGIVVSMAPGFEMYEDEVIEAFGAAWGNGAADVSDSVGFPRAVQSFFRGFAAVIILTGVVTAAAGIWLAVWLYKRGVEKS